MATSIQYHHDHAVVSFKGELDWPSSLDLVESVDTAIRAYCYSTIEIVVSSPGGDANALLYFLDAMKRWREHRIHIRTRVTAIARSAAAIMVALGDERVGDRGATLHFHHPHAAVHGDCMNAPESASLSRALQRMDDRLLAHLVQRAFRDSPARPSHARCAAHASDRHVLETLWDATVCGAEKPPRKVRKLAQAIGQTVDGAIRTGDRSTLTEMYRCLLNADRSISSDLACSLGLLDRIGPIPHGAAQSKGTPGLTIPEWSALYPPFGEVSREILTRHTLVLGETGSGKTASVILPIVAAVARSHPGHIGAALVIDPKSEIGPVLMSLAPERLHEVIPGRVVINLMSGPRWCLADDLGVGRWLSAATRILCRVASFITMNPARVLLGHTSAKYDEFWDREGTALALVVLSFVLMVTAEDAPPAKEWLKDDSEAIDFVEQLRSRSRGVPGERGPNAVALAAWCIDGPALTRSESASGSFDGEWLFTRVARAALEHWGDEPGEGRDVLQRIIDYWDSISRTRGQYAGVRATARVVCADFAAPSIATSLYFGCEAGYFAASRTGDSVDFSRAVARDASGTLILFQPARDGLDALIAMALKASFFEAVLEDPDRVKGGAHLPLVTYIADEAHRFITSDVVHGEQSFLDTCRSFGAACVLACQSVSSLEHALAQGGGGSTLHESAVSILWTNTGSKFIFRTTDSKTCERISDLCPRSPGLAPISQVRPPSTLGPGECFALLADGRFERRQLSHFNASSRSKSRHEEQEKSS